MTKNIQHIVQENQRRLEQLFFPYNPVLGIGSPIERFPFFVTKDQEEPAYFPVEMMEIDEIQKVLESECRSAEEYALENGLNPQIFLKSIHDARFDNDFEFWAATCVKIKNKEGGPHIAFVLNGPQRKLFKLLWSMYTNKKPIRAIILKARQWGGSTLVQVFMAWIQLRHKISWNSLIAAHLNQAAINIRTMYKTLADQYPLESISITPFESTTNIKIIKSRNNKITIGSMEKPDSIRSDDVAMAHLSEVGLWKKTEGKKPEDLLQSILGTIPNRHCSVLVMESTAKGVGNFFHRTWLDSKSGENEYKPIFIAWFEIHNYTAEFDSEEEKIQLIKTLSKYEKYLWSLGATLEGIKWHRIKLREYGGSMVSMGAEFPSDDVEAFQSTGARFFPVENIQKARKFNRKPLYVGDVYGDAYTGPDALNNIRIEKAPKGRFAVWSDPEIYPDVKFKNRYCVSVDIGGRSKEADDSVITVWDRLPLMDGGILEKAACWAGKIDFDQLAWKCVQICKLYDDAFMIPEINKMREDQEKFDEGDQFYTLMDEIIDYYDNVFCRTNPEQIREGMQRVYGFHTNKQTKPMILNALNAAYRDDQVANFDQRSMDQADTYENKGNGSTGAVSGSHDDFVMSDALGVWCSLSYMDPVVEINITPRKVSKRKKRSMADF